MASTAAAHPEPRPTGPTLLSAAASTLDLTGVPTVLETFRKLAEITQRHGPEAHQRMLDQIDRIRHGHDVTTISGHDHKAEIRSRLNRRKRA